MQAKEHFWYLDGLRGLAAFAVVLLHWFDGHSIPLFGSSLLAVDFFFMLSGLVIAHSYQERLEAGYSRVRYMVARVIRLYPLILFSIFIGVVRYLGRDMAMGAEARSFGYLEAISFNLFLIPIDPIKNTAMFPLNIPLWSLHFEMILYLLFVLILYRLGTKALLAVAALALAAASVSMQAKFGVKEDVLDYIPTEYPSSLGRAILSFCLGILVYRTAAHPMVAKYSRKLASRWLFVPVLLLFLCPREFIHPVLVLVIMATVLPAIVSAGRWVELSGRPLKFARFAGDLSYPIYVLHVPIMWALSGVLKKLGLFSEPVWNGLIIIPVILVSSYFVMRFFDMPVRAALKRRFP